MAQLEMNEQSTVHEKVSKQDILDYKNTLCARMAADLLMMYGPDGFDGNYSQYEALLSDLEEEAIYDEV